MDKYFKIDERKINLSILSDKMRFGKLISKAGNLTRILKAKPIVNYQDVNLLVLEEAVIEQENNPSKVEYILKINEGEKTFFVNNLDCFLHPSYGKKGYYEEITYKNNLMIDEDWGLEYNSALDLFDKIKSPEQLIQWKQIRTI